VHLAQKCYLDLKGLGMKDKVSTYLEMSLTGSNKNRTLSLKYHEKESEKITLIENIIQFIPPERSKVGVLKFCIGMRSDITCGYVTSFSSRTGKLET